MKKDEAWKRQRGSQQDTRPKPRKKKPKDERARRNGRINTRPRNEEDARGTRDQNLETKLLTRRKAKREANRKPGSESSSRISRINHYGRTRKMGPRENHDTNTKRSHARKRLGLGVCRFFNSNDYFSIFFG